METSALDRILSWMRGTDLVEMKYREGPEGFELRLEGAHPEAAFPSSRLVPVSSPGVGVFRFGAAGRPRRAEPGAAVAVGEALGIVDTGGRPLEIVAPAAGLLTKVLAEDGMPVEYGQPLFLISP